MRFLGVEGGHVPSQTHSPCASSPGTCDCCHDLTTIATPISQLEQLRLREHDGGWRGLRSTYLTRECVPGPVPSLLGLVTPMTFFTPSPCTERTSCCSCSSQVHWQFHSLHFQNILKNPKMERGVDSSAFKLIKFGGRSWWDRCQNRTFCKQDRSKNRTFWRYENLYNKKSVVIGGMLIYIKGES